MEVQVIERGTEAVVGVVVVGHCSHVGVSSDGFAHAKHLKSGVGDVVEVDEVAVTRLYDDAPAESDERKNARDGPADRGVDTPAEGGPGLWHEVKRISLRVGIFMKTVLL